MSELSLESLQAQIKELGEIVTRQKQIITKTGQQLLEIQLKQTQDQLKNISIPKLNEDGTSQPVVSSSGAVDMSDYATNDDIVQLVGELQGQLTILEQRSLRRTLNSTLTKDTQRLAPILNADGDEPSADEWPVTLKDFKELKDTNILKLCAFYELLPPTAEEEATMKAFLNGKIESPNVDIGNLKFEPENYSREILDEFYDDLARFCGLKTRKTEDGW